jgi:hypothetical protein
VAVEEDDELMSVRTLVVCVVEGTTTEAEVDDSTAVVVAAVVAGAVTGGVGDGTMTMLGS